ncbi:MAG TPA: LCP family protein [Capillimicrobium sp.]|nr:LCP family protein [Capillimicrobium sp.]
MSVYEEVDARPVRHGRRMLWKFLLAAVIITFASAAATASTLLLEVDRLVKVFDDNSGPSPVSENVLDKVPAGEPQTIMLLGSDRRYVDKVQGNPARSDTIILVRLDPDRGVTAVLSIPRDLKVNIPTKNGVVTDKINAAYSIGGPELTLKTVKNLLHIPIHHIVNINFGGFEDAVNTLGCVYVDVDRRYFNDNNPPNGSPYDYATIDVKPGYQKLCGGKSLDYVRYRHFDTDLVRSARQQDFLRQAKEQIGVSKLLNDREQLLKVFAKHTQTDVKGTDEVLSLLKLGYESAKNPIQEVHFQADIGESYVEASPEQIAATRREFLEARASENRGEPQPREGDGQRRRQTRKREAGTYPGTFDAAQVAEDQAVQVAVALTKLRPKRQTLPVYYPKLAAVGSEYMSEDSTPRAYRIVDRSGERYKAYRLVVRAPGLGQYYGIQGTTWKAPPILDNPSETRTIGGRDYDLFYDGKRLRMVAFRTDDAAYWVSNTLLQTLTEKQMLGIATSLTRVGS